MLSLVEILTNFSKRVKQHQHLANLLISQIYFITAFTKKKKKKWSKYNFHLE